MKPKELRDDFAIQALVHVLPDAIQHSNDHGDFVVDGELASPEAYVAYSCYVIADAMMAEREKTNDPD